MKAIIPFALSDGMTKYFGTESTLIRFTLVLHFAACSKMKLYLLKYIPNLLLLVSHIPPKAHYYNLVNATNSILA